MGHVWQVIGSIGYYRKNAIAIDSEAHDSLGGNV